MFSLVTRKITKRQHFRMPKYYSENERKTAAFHQRSYKTKLGCCRLICFEDLDIEVITLSRHKAIITLWKIKWTIKSAQD